MFMLSLYQPVLNVPVRVTTEMATDYSARSSFKLSGSISFIKNIDINVAVNTCKGPNKCSCLMISLKLAVRGKLYYSGKGRRGLTTADLPVLPGQKHMDFCYALFSVELLLGLFPPGFFRFLGRLLFPGLFSRSDGLSTKGASLFSPLSGKK